MKQITNPRVPIRARVTPEGALYITRCAHCEFHREGTNRRLINRDANNHAAEHRAGRTWDLL